jgi:DHA1 family tetracycline resistance protein-like MFS transporter
MGAVSSLNSLMAVLGADHRPDPADGQVAHLPQGDWRIGTPFLLCAALQVLALLMALQWQGRTHPLIPEQAHA